MSVFANGREGVGDNRDEQVDEPEIEYNDADDKEKAGNEEL